jgi:hypothetical protein
LWTVSGRLVPCATGAAAPGGSQQQPATPAVISQSVMMGFALCTCEM